MRVMQRSPAELQLVKVLQSAVSGELAAGFAYRGHAKSVRLPAERSRLQQIEQEEWHHRALVQGLLAELGAKPSGVREIVFWLIGRSIGLLCRIGGWFIPMFGAGLLERGNIEEYEVAARYAQACGRPEMIDCLLAMAEVEWDHEQYFRERIQGHRLTRVFRIWEAPPARATIRARYAATENEQEHLYGHRESLPAATEL